MPCQEIFLVRHKKIRATSDTDFYSSILSVRRIRLIIYCVVFSLFCFRCYDLLFSDYYQTSAQLTGLCSFVLVVVRQFAPSCHQLSLHHESSHWIFSRYFCSPFHTRFRDNYCYFGFVFATLLLEVYSLSFFSVYRL